VIPQAKGRFKSKTQAVYESLLLVNPIKYDVLYELELINYPTGQEDNEVKRGRSLADVKQLHSLQDGQKTRSKEPLMDQISALKITSDAVEITAQLPKPKPPP
jgi:hypothetical protein